MSKFCTKCGNQVDDNTKFCDKCGAPMNGGAQPSQGDGMNKGMAVLSYIIPLIPYLINPKEKFAKYHATQGFNLWLITIIYNVAYGIVDGFLPGIITGILGLADIFFSVLCIMGIVYAAQGKMTELPVVGSIKIVKERED